MMYMLCLLCTVCSIMGVANAMDLEWEPFEERFPNPPNLFKKDEKGKNWLTAYGGAVWSLRSG